MRVSIGKLRQAIESSEEVQRELQWLLEVMRAERRVTAPFQALEMEHEGARVVVNIEVGRFPGGGK